MNYIDILVIGAGVSGLGVANALQRSGKSVVVVEKARGSGGRISSKRTNLDDGSQVTFDLGCASFSAKTPEFKQMLELAQAQVATIEEEGELRYCGYPRNSMLTRYLADNLDVHFSHRVSAIEPVDAGWKVSCETSSGDTKQWHCARLIISAPPAQSAALLPSDHAAQALLQQSAIAPQWVVALALDDQTSLRAALQRLAQHKDIEKISIENDKPVRTYPSGLCVFVLHFSPRWTEQTIDWDKERVRAFALKCLRDEGMDSAVPRASHVHRWLYSLPKTGLESLQFNRAEQNEPYYLDDSGVALCGDYLASEEFEGVERAWLSATALAEVLNDIEAADSKAAAPMQTAEENSHGH